MRIRIFIGVFALLMLNTAMLFAQITQPCEGTDPDAVCPLDSWVVLLAIGALIFAVIHLRRRQQSFSRSNAGPNRSKGARLNVN